MLEQKPRKYKITGTITATLLLFGSFIGGCNSNIDGDPNADSIQQQEVFNNAAPGSETPNGIAPLRYADTLKHTDPLAIDSIKLSISFQLAANALSKAYLNKDALAYAKYTPPSIEKAMGGKSNYLSRLQTVFNDPTAPNYNKILSGPIQRTKPQLDDQGYLQGWYCLMPVRMFRTEAGKTMQDVKWMGGQSLDEGKTIYFIDITNMPPEKIMQIMPDLRVVLVK